MLLPFGFTSYSLVQLLLALYGNLLPVALYSVWLAVAIVELAQREELSSARKLGWSTLVLAVPLLGPVIYYLAGGSKLKGRFRLALVVGAPCLCLLATALIMVVAYFTL
jgi:hypothetical protein